MKIFYENILQSDGIIKITVETKWKYNFSYMFQDVSDKYVSKLFIENDICCKQTFLKPIF